MNQRLRGFQESLQAGAVLLLDGGLATELEGRGFDLRHPLWSGRILSDDPLAIQSVHSDYAQAGANILTTASYQLSAFGLKGAESQMLGPLLDRSVQLARNVARSYFGRDLWVAGSIGPMAAALADGSEYVGYGVKVTDDELLLFHRDRFCTLANKVDVLACETIPSIAEIRVLTKLLETVETPAWISVTLKDERHLADGTPLEMFAEMPFPKNVVAIGCNCIPPQWMVGALTILSKSSLAKIVYPNSGEIYDGKTRSWSGTSFHWTTGDARRLLELGCKIIGGCCRTTPEFIRYLGEAIKGLS